VESQLPSATPQPAPFPTIRPDSLDYGRPVPLRRRRGFRRTVVVAFLIFAAAFAIRPLRYYWGSIWLWQLQHQCLTHPIPPGTLVYTSGSPPQVVQSAELNRLFANYGYTPGPFYSTNWPLAQLDPKHDTIATSTVYVGKRTATNGRTQFLAITACINLYNAKEIELIFDIWDTPMALSRNQSALAGGVIPGLYGLPVRAGANVSPRLKIYSATEDPSDPSHFSFTYDYDAWHCTIDCWLQPNGSLRSQGHEQLWTIKPDGTRTTPMINWP
jgi:hypothetical protein